jgi:RNA polymerase sigma-70 factor (ECF subfamily)
MKEDDIYNLLLSRDQNGLSLMLDQYGPLIAFVVRNTGLVNNEDVSECISDIIFTVWRRVKKYNPAKSSFKTWIVMVTRGCAIDYIRKNKKPNTVISLSDLEKTYGRELHSGTSALDYLINPDIIQLLQQLPPPDNEIFYRRFVLGEKVTDIADLLGLNQDTIYKRIQRGRSKLKILMEREGYNYG